MTLVTVQHGTWQGVEADIELDSRAAAAFLTAAHDYMAETGRPMPEIVEPAGGLRTTAQTTEMQWAFDHKGTAASDAIYAKYNMSRVSTARPAINGTHTTGLFFDVATSAFMAWILAGNGRRYGITRPLLNDPNHCQVSPGTETVALNVTALDNTTKGDTPMSAIDTCYASHSSTFYIVHEAGCDAIPLSQRPVWNQRVLGLITAPWDDANLPYLGAWLAGAPATLSPGVQPGQESNEIVLKSWLAGRGIPVVPTWEKPYRFPVGGAPTDAQLAALVPAIVSGVLAKLPAVPTAEQIGAEVIRQQKLPGN